MKVPYTELVLSTPLIREQIHLHRSGSFHGVKGIPVQAHRVCAFPRNTIITGLNTKSNKK
ncbi:MAG: hypothetical protein PHF57_11155 [Methanoregula sp.]|nr:hypothetical protein [Methanoregula sp.]MDD5188752.1 hypothetical protein [Methanoregula sp.]